MPRLPQLTARELVRFLKHQGFVEDRQSGSHLTLWHPTRKVAVTVPIHTSIDIGRGLAARILKDAGFTVEDYFAPWAPSEGEHTTPPAAASRPRTSVRSPPGRAAGGPDFLIDARAGWAGSCRPWLRSYPASRARIARPSLASSPPIPS